VRIAYPISIIKVQLLNLAMAEEACKANPIVGQMRLLSKNGDVVFPRTGIILEEFLSACSLVRIAGKIYS
jgi:hypothetical protein